MLRDVCWLGFGVGVGLDVSVGCVGAFNESDDVRKVGRFLSFSDFISSPRRSSLHFNPNCQLLSVSIAMGRYTAL